MADIFTPAVLNRVVQDLKADAPSMFLLNTFFPEISVSTQEEIFFDVLTNKPRLAPFVSPLVEGQIVHMAGYKTNVFTPAYIKDKRVFEAGKALRRAPGEPIAVAVDPAAQRRRDLGINTVDQVDMINRRLEWMASEVLRTGSVTVAGEKYPTSVVNFGRDAALTVTLSGTARWNDSAPTILDNLETWAGLVRDKSGANAVDLIMAQDAYAALRKDPEVRALLKDGLSARTNLDLGPDVMVGNASFMGQVGAFRLWVYTESYTADDGTTKKFVPDNYVLLVSRQIEGVRHFGAIKDEEAGFQVLDMYQKSWTQPDPSVRFLLMQSAPLVVPYRINASLAAKVI